MDRWCSFCLHLLVVQWSNPSMKAASYAVLKSSKSELVNQVPCSIFWGEVDIESNSNECNSYIDKWNYRSILYQNIWDVYHTKSNAFAKFREKNQLRLLEKNPREANSGTNDQTHRIAIFSKILWDLAKGMIIEENLLPLAICQDLWTMYHQRFISYERSILEPWSN